MSGFQCIPFLMRLKKVAGLEERFNDIVYGAPAKIVDKTKVLVFFGGDVQGFTENMVGHDKNKEFVKWNLENTAKLLQSTFEECHIVVINPVRKDLQTYSCFDNFVPTTKYGIPKHESMYHALVHLDKLLLNIHKRLTKMTEQELSTAVELCRKSIMMENLEKSSGIDQESVAAIETYPDGFMDYELKLVGFSKGCVVLNQLILEFHHFKKSTNRESDLPRILSKITDMYWLDGGHSGSSNTWITSRSLLETLAGLGINIHVHVTPYQMEDPHRPWIKKEEIIFSSTLQELGAPVFHKIHFKDAEPSLDMHFNVLTVFGKG